MGAVGAKVTGPYGQPWRTGKRPYGHSTLKLVASCLKGFYLHVSGLGTNEELGKRLDRSRLPTRQDRNRALLGHTQKRLPKNPLTPKQVRRRHPKMAPEGAKQILMCGLWNGTHAPASTRSPSMSPSVTPPLDGSFRASRSSYGSFWAYLGDPLEAAHQVGSPCSANRPHHLDLVRIGQRRPRLARRGRLPAIRTTVRRPRPRTGRSGRGLPRRRPRPGRAGRRRRPECRGRTRPRSAPAGR